MHRSGPDVFYSKQGTDVAADLSIVNPLCETHAGDGVDTLLEAVNRVKRQRYGDTAKQRGVLLLPLPATAQGHLGPELTKLCKSIADGTHVSHASVCNRYSALIAYGTGRARLAAEQALNIAPPTLVLESRSEAWCVKPESPSRKREPADGPAPVSFVPDATQVATFCARIAEAMTALLGGVDAASAPFIERVVVNARKAEAERRRAAKAEAHAAADAREEVASEHRAALEADLRENEAVVRGSFNRLISMRNSSHVAFGGAMAQLEERDAASRKALETAQAEQRVAADFVRQFVEESTAVEGVLDRTVAAHKQYGAEFAEHRQRLSNEANERISTVEAETARLEASNDAHREELQRMAEAHNIKRAKVEAELRQRVSEQHQLADDGQAYDERFMELDGRLSYAREYQAKMIAKSRSVAHSMLDYADSAVQISPATGIPVGNNGDVLVPTPAAEPVAAPRLQQLPAAPSLSFTSSPSLEKHSSVPPDSVRLRIGSRSSASLSRERTSAPPTVAKRARDSDSQQRVSPSPSPEPQRPTGHASSSSSSLSCRLDQNNLPHGAHNEERNENNGSEATRRSGNSSSSSGNQSSRRVELSVVACDRR